MSNLLDIIKGTTIELGTATGTVADPLYNSVRASNFNMFVNENCCKMCYMSPKQGTVAFNAEAKQMIADAKAGGKKLKLTPLAWNMQCANWYNILPVAQKQAALLSYVKAAATLAAAAGFYKLDVVNEALDNTYNINQFFKDAGGEPTIVKCFQVAAAAHPKAILVYNDFGITTDGARATYVRALVARLIAAGAPIHEVGIQCHEFASRCVTGPITPDKILLSMQLFKDLGVRVNFSEIDLRCDPAVLDSTLTLDQRFQASAAAFSMLFKVGLSRPDICNNMTFWQYTGKYNWIPICYNIDPMYCAVPWGNQIEELPAVASIKQALQEVAPLHTPGNVFQPYKPVAVLGGFGLKPWGILSAFADPAAQWVWNAPGAATSAPAGPVIFKTFFDNAAGSAAAVLHAIVDNSCTVYVNGQAAGKVAGNGWKTTAYSKIPITLRPAGNTITFCAANSTVSTAGLLFSVIDATTQAVLARSDATTVYL